MKRRLSISFVLAALFATSPVFSQTPTPKTNTTPAPTSPDKRWSYDCAPSVLDECLPQLVNATTNDVVVDLEGDSGVYGRYSRRANVAWSPDSKRFAFNFAEVASHAYFTTTSFYELRGDKWELLESFSKDDSTAGMAVTKALDDALAAERRKRHLKARKGEPSGRVIRVQEWTDPDTAVVYAYALGDAETGTMRVDLLLTLKFDKAGKIKVAKTQKLSEKEREKYEKDSED